jgi:hypothetical protein
VREELLFAVANRHYFDTKDEALVVPKAENVTRGELDGALVALDCYYCTLGLDGLKYNSDESSLQGLIAWDKATQGLVEKGYLENLGTDTYEKGPYLPTKKCEEFVK